MTRASDSANGSGTSSPEENRKHLDDVAKAAIEAGQRIQRGGQGQQNGQDQDTK